MEANWPQFKAAIQRTASDNTKVAQLQRDLRTKRSSSSIQTTLGTVYLTFLGSGTYGTVFKARFVLRITV